MLEKTVHEKLLMFKHYQFDIKLLINHYDIIVKLLNVKLVV